MVSELKLGSVEYGRIWQVMGPNAVTIADVVNSADIADWILRTLRWKQVDMYKVLRGCPVTVPPF